MIINTVSTSGSMFCFNGLRNVFFGGSFVVLACGCARAFVCAFVWLSACACSAVCAVVYVVANKNKIILVENLLLFMGVLKGENSQFSALLLICKYYIYLFI